MPTQSPYQDLYGLSRIPGQPPNPTRVFFEDFIGAGVASISSATTGNAKFFHGGVNSEAVTMGNNSQSGHLVALSANVSGDTVTVTTATGCAVYRTAVTPEGDENPISFFARARNVAGASHLTSAMWIGMGNDDGTVIDPTADIMTLASGAGAVTNFIGFRVEVTTGNISTVTRLDTGSGTYSEVATATGLSTSTMGGAGQSAWIVFGWEFDGKTKIKFSVNGKVVDTRYVGGSSVPVTPAILYPIIHARTASAALSGFHLDWLYVSTSGPRTVIE